MRKAILEKRLARLEEKRNALKERARVSDAVEELREIQDKIAEINDDIADVTEELAAIEAEERAAVPETAETRGEQSVRAAYHMGTTPETRGDDQYATMEYRKAFMRYAQTGAETAGLIQRNGDAANTQTLAAIIPTTIMDEFINEVQKSYGNLYAKVRKMSVPGGVKIPVGKLQAKLKWITESTVSPRQDGGSTEAVTFAYHVGEIRVAQTLLSSIVSLPLFEAEVVRIMSEAYLEAMDIGIVNGSGDGQMTGILNDPRVLATGNEVTFTAAQLSDWKAWRKNFLARIPLKYRRGEFIFPVSTVDSYLETMSDDNNNPVFRQATGLEMGSGDAADPAGRFFGRTVELVEPDVIPDFDAADAGDVIGIYWQPEQYAINTNMAFEMRRWFDEDANEWVNKLLVIVDGKVLNPEGFWLIKKG